MNTHNKLALAISSLLIPLTMPSYAITLSGDQLKDVHASWIETGKEPNLTISGSDITVNAGNYEGLKTLEINSGNDVELDASLDLDKLTQKKSRGKVKKINRLKINDNKTLKLKSFYISSLGTLEAENAEIVYDNRKLDPVEKQQTGFDLSGIDSALLDEVVVINNDANTSNRGSYGMYGLRSYNNKGLTAENITIRQESSHHYSTISAFSAGINSKFKGEESPVINVKNILTTRQFFYEGSKLDEPSDNADWLRTKGWVSTGTPESSARGISLSSSKNLTLDIKTAIIEQTSEADLRLLGLYASGDAGTVITKFDKFIYRPVGTSSTEKGVLGWYVGAFSDEKGTGTSTVSANTVDFSHAGIMNYGIRVESDDPKSFAKAEVYKEFILGETSDDFVSAFEAIAHYQTPEELAQGNNTAGNTSEIHVNGKVVAKLGEAQYLATSLGGGATVNLEITDKDSELQGRLLAQDGGAINMTLGTDVEARMSLFEHDEPDAAARIDWLPVSIGVNAEAFPEIDKTRTPKAGKIKLTLEDGSRWNAYGKKANELDDLVLNGGTANLEGVGSPTEYNVALRTNNLEGSGGIFQLRINTDEDVARSQVIRIAQSSSGTHQLYFNNAGHAVATKKPILVVESVNGKDHPEKFQAVFTSGNEVEVGELRYQLGSTDAVNREATQGEHPESGLPDEQNLKNWYLYPVYSKSNPNPDPGTDPDTPSDPNPGTDPDTPSDPNPIAFTDTALSGLGTTALHYLAGTASIETLRQRLGDVHQFMTTDQGNTPWVKLIGDNWSLDRVTGLSNWNFNRQGAELGIDHRINEHAVVGAFFAYDHLSTEAGLPSSVKGNHMMLGLYWTHLWDNRTYLDTVLRLGRTESKFHNNDTVGATVKDDHISSYYQGISVELGRQYSLNSSWTIEPQAQIAYTHFGHLNVGASNGLSAHTAAYDSLITRLGVTTDWHHTTESGRPWTFYGKLQAEREWLAKPDVVFNGHNHYDLTFKDTRLVYGLGVESTMGKATSWHVSLERSNGHHFQKDWRIDAGLRIPF